MAFRLKKLKEVVKNKNKILCRNKTNKNKNPSHLDLLKRIRNQNLKVGMKKDPKVKTLSLAN